MLNTVDVVDSFSFPIFLMCWILLSVPDFFLVSLLFSKVYCIFKFFLLHFHFLPVFSSIGQHLHRPLPWSSRYKLKFEIMPCGYELAFSTKSNNVIYRDEGREKNDASLCEYIRLFILSKGVEVSVVCETDGRRETKLIAILTHNFFSWP